MSGLARRRSESADELEVAVKRRARRYGRRRRSDLEQAAVVYKLLRERGCGPLNDAARALLKRTREEHPGVIEGRELAPEWLERLRALQGALPALRDALAAQHEIRDVELGEIAQSLDLSAEEVFAAVTLLEGENIGGTIVRVSRRKGRQNAHGRIPFASIALAPRSEV